MSPERRVAFDLTAGDVDAGGTGVHARELAAALAADGAPIVPVRAPRRAAAAGGWRRRFATLERDLWWAQHGAEAAARAAGASLLHCPVPIGPVRGTLPLVVTIHDLFALTDPGDFRPWHRWYTRATLAPLVRRARRVITVSETTRIAVLEQVAVDPARVVVVPNGVHARFRPLAADDPARSAVSQRYALPSRFLLAVGAIEPRKNLARLLGAVRRVLRGGTTASAPDLTLVHAGPAGWRNADVHAARAALDAEGLGAHVRWLGPVAVHDLPALYAQATAVVYPSLRHGFGLPIAEAMACGVPVLTSDVGALREVAGDAALLVPPDDEAAIGAALVRLWHDAPLRARLAAAGPSHVAALTWQQVAAATRRVYDEALA